MRALALAAVVFCVGLRVADAATLPDEKTIVLAPFVVSGRSMRLSCLSFDVKERPTAIPSSVVVIEKVVVARVVANSAAAAAGVAAGDELVQVGDLAAAGMDASRWHDIFLRAHPGETWRFLFRKAGTKKTVLYNFRFAPEAPRPATGAN